MVALTMEKALTAVQSSVERIKNDETAEIGTMSLGDVLRQGDLYIIAVGGIPDDSKEITSRQLVPGNTQGSRHVLLGDCKVFAVDAQKVISEIVAALKGQKLSLFPELIGPMFRCEQPVELDHPEHGNRILPAGTYATVYQRAYADVVRRQMD